MQDSNPNPKKPQPGKNAAAQSGANSERRELNKRRLYIQTRLQEIQERIKGFVAERTESSKTMEGRSGEKGDDIKKIRDRRSYAVMRAAELRTEQKALFAEKKTVQQAIIALAKKK